MMGILDSKTIIITGGSVGIGSVIANKCASEGAEVIIVARNKKDLDSSLNNLKTISDKNHRSYSLDVKDLNAIKAFAIWLENEGLIINGLVNCAGVYGPIGKTTDVDMDKFTETININFLGTVYMCNMIAPLMKNNGHNKIINYSDGTPVTLRKPQYIILDLAYGNLASNIEISHRGWRFKKAIY